jgi:hypothetical protein
MYSRSQRMFTLGRLFNAEQNIPLYLATHFPPRFHPLPFQLIIRPPTLPPSPAASGTARHRRGAQRHPAGAGSAGRDERATRCCHDHTIAAASPFPNRHCAPARTHFGQAHHAPTAPHLGASPGDHAPGDTSRDTSRDTFASAWDARVL